MEGVRRVRVITVSSRGLNIRTHVHSRKSSYQQSGGISKLHPLHLKLRYTLHFATSARRVTAIQNQATSPFNSRSRSWMWQFQQSRPLPRDLQQSQSQHRTSPKLRYQALHSSRTATSSSHFRKSAMSNMNISRKCSFRSHYNYSKVQCPK